jgi:hypothetical protein
VTRRMTGRIQQTSQGPQKRMKDHNNNEEEEDQTNGAGMHLGQSKVPEAGLKRKDKEPEHNIGGVHERKLRHNDMPCFIF